MKYEDLPRELKEIVERLPNNNLDQASLVNFINEVRIFERHKLQEVGGATAKMMDFESWFPGYSEFEKRCLSGGAKVFVPQFLDMLMRTPL